MIEIPDEKCSVFGIYTADSQAANLTYFGNFEQNHRGQEGTGILSSDGREFYLHKKMGLVLQAYNPADIDALKGHMAIGHNRYATSRTSVNFEEEEHHLQPVFSEKRLLGLAHNGNLPTVRLLKQYLELKGEDTDGKNDSELMHQAIEYNYARGASLYDSVAEVYPYIKGAASVVLMTKDKVAAFRDSRGIRPLSIGKWDGGYAIASETCALDEIQSVDIRDIEPGQMVEIDHNGLTSYQLDPNPKLSLDVFEFIYFSRPDSYLLGKRVYEVRKNLGRILGERYKHLDLDCIIPVPDTSIPIAEGYSETAGIPHTHALIKNKYIGRTFIEPVPELREKMVEMKFSAISEEIRGKRVGTIDDSIVRGTTNRGTNRIGRVCHPDFLANFSGSPEVMFSDLLGIDTPKREKLLAAKMSTWEMQKELGADFLAFSTIPDLIQAIGLPRDVLSFHVLDGKYPLEDDVLEELGLLVPA